MAKASPVQQLQGIRQVFNARLAVDLGSQHTRLQVLGTRKRRQLPTMLALAEDNKTILGMGSEALELLGKVGSQMTIARPVRQGVLRDINSSTIFLRYLFQQLLPYSWLIKPVVLASVASDATTVEREALQEVLLQAGGRKVYLVDQPLAAAIGVGLPVAESSGNVLIQLGAGITEMSVMSLGSSIAQQSVRWGGERLDEVILRYIRQQAQIEVNSSTAEFLKHQLSPEIDDKQPERITVKGRHVVSGKPTEASLLVEDLITAIEPVFEELVIMIQEFLEDVPSEVATDVIDTGIILSGGGAQLPGLSQALTDRLGVPVAVGEQPEQAVLNGLKVVGEHLDLYERSLGFE